MQRITYTFVILSLLTFLVAFSSCPPTKSALQVEAERKAQQYFDRTVARCDDGYYVKVNWTEFVRGGLLQEQDLFQIKNPDTIIKETPLTEADRLNGVEWRGSLTIITTAHRKLEGKQWGEWRDGGPQRVTMTELGSPSLLYLGDGSFYKKQGHWSIDQPDTNPSHIKPSCSEILSN